MIKFVGSFETVKSLPRTQFAEYAFIGRSNVGKSSLVNAVVGAPIARTSNTPGRTQSINMFNIDDRVMIVDLPGYGYARVSRVDAMRWLQRLEEYLLNRRQLKRLFILIDSRIGVRDSDLDFVMQMQFRIKSFTQKKIKKYAKQIKHKLSIQNTVQWCRKSWKHRRKKRRA